MKTNIVLLLSLFSLCSAYGQQKVYKRDLPVAVVQSLDRSFQQYTIQQVVRVDRVGTASGFRIRVQKSDGTWDVELDTQGRVRERVVVVERQSREHHHHEDHCDHHDDDDHCDHHHEHKHKHKHEHYGREHHNREHHDKHQHCHHD